MSDLTQYNIDMQLTPKEGISEDEFWDKLYDLITEADFVHDVGWCLVSKEEY